MVDLEKIKRYIIEHKKPLLIGAVTALVLRSFLS